MNESNGGMKRTYGMVEESSMGMDDGSTQESYGKRVKLEMVDKTRTWGGAKSFSRKKRNLKTKKVGEIKPLMDIRAYLMPRGEELPGDLKEHNKTKLQ